MATEPLRIGVVGVGFGALVQIPGFLSEGVEVVAVCSRREERARAAAEKFGIPHVFTDYNQMLESPDLDAVSIVTPLPLHKPFSIAALEAGKHVMCEKPFTMSQQGAKEMLDAAQSHSHLTAMVSHGFRWAPQRAFVKELLEEGYIGKFHFFQANLFTNPRRAAQPPALPPEADRRDAMEPGLTLHRCVSALVWRYRQCNRQSNVPSPRAHRPGDGSNPAHRD